MADLPTNLETLQDNADDIALVVDSISTAIEGRGGTLPENAGLRDFPGAITNIPDRFTPTEAQLAAMNSGITAEKVEKTDRIIMDDTETQDYYMQNSTPSNPSEGDYWITDEPIVSSDVSAMTGYTKAQSASAIAATDTLNQAVGKLEKVLDGKQATIDANNKLSSDLVDDSNATNKFATAAQLTQIETNKNNILLIEHAVDTKLFFMETEPTGTITVGSYWISTTGTRVYAISPNLYDYTATDTNNGYVDNTWLKNDGTTVSDNNYEISEYIEVKPNTTYTLTIGVLLNSPSVCYYNSSKNYISGDTYGQANPKIVTTPADTKYIRVSVQKANEELFEVKEGTTGYIWQ